MSQLFSGMALAVTLSASLFATSAMADSLTLRGSQFHVSVGASASDGGGGAGGGGSQEVMNDDYDHHVHHAPVVRDFGKPVNVLTAHDRPLDTNSIVANDPDHKLNLLQAKGNPLDTASFIVEDPDHKLNFLTARDMHGKLIPIPVVIRDAGKKRVKELAWAYFTSEVYQDSLPVCDSDHDSYCRVPTCGTPEAANFDHGKDCVPAN